MNRIACIFEYSVENSKVCRSRIAIHERDVTNRYIYVENCSLSLDLIQFTLTRGNFTNITLHCFSILSVLIPNWVVRNKCPISCSLLSYSGLHRCYFSNFDTLNFQLDIHSRRHQQNSAEVNFSWHLNHIFPIQGDLPNQRLCCSSNIIQSLSNQEHKVAEYVVPKNRVDLKRQDFLSSSTFALSFENWPQVRIRNHGLLNGRRLG